jgi:hypothetical protein
VPAVRRIERIELALRGAAPLRVGRRAPRARERRLGLLAVVRGRVAAARVQSRDSGQARVESTRAVERLRGFARLRLTREHEPAVQLRARVVRVLALRAIELGARRVDLVEVVVTLGEIARDAGQLRIELARLLERRERLAVLALAQEAAALHERRACVLRIQLARAPGARQRLVAAIGGRELLGTLAEHRRLVSGASGQRGEPQGQGQGQTREEATCACGHERLRRPPAIPSSPTSISTPDEGSGIGAVIETKSKLHLGIPSS